MEHKYLTLSLAAHRKRYQQKLNFHLSESFYLQVATQVGILHCNVLKGDTTNITYLQSLSILPPVDT